MCESWRQENQSSSNGVYRDIYDGKVWKYFLAPNEIPFLSVSHNYALKLNVDWFQPFHHTQHSEGAIYMSILNFPILAQKIPSIKYFDWNETLLNMFCLDFVKLCGQEHCNINMHLHYTSCRVHL